MTTSKIPPQWTLIEQVLDSRLVRIIYLYGPPGIGKTWAAYYLGRINRGVQAVTVTEDTPSAELRGYYFPGENGMDWHDGPVSVAMRNGGRLVVNEISHATADVWTYLHPILESTGTARLTLPNNETVTAHADFHVVCTDNEGPECLPEALRDRFDAIIEVTEPHPDALARLSEPLRSAFVNTLDVEAERRTSLRSWLAVERMREEFGLLSACVLAFGTERGQEIHDALSLATA